MKKTSLAIIASLAAGFAAAAIVLNVIDPVAKAPAVPLPTHFDDTAEIEERLRALEAAVGEERQARQLLEDELLVLYGELERLESDGGEENPVPEARGRVESVAVERIREIRGDRSTTNRREALIEAGIAPGRADWILQRESEMRFEFMQAVYDARNSDEPRAGYSAGMNPEAMLRTEIGDAEYEKYLEASGRPTSVGISSIMASSPAERAGLQPGDEITGYDGQRVFSTSELMQHTMTGGEGNVVVDVMRDGAPMQIVVPRGPIGVEIGRYRRP